jgi:putative photosynthetic complex assembly protein 2
VSTSGLAFALACWLERLYAVDAIGDQIGFTLLSAMTALALLEHWVMVLPVPDAKLWRWMLPTPKQSKNKSFKREDFHGF